MKILGKYSFNNGEEEVMSRYPVLFDEIRRVIHSISAEGHRTKESKEKTMPGDKLFSPKSLNVEFRKGLLPLGWKKMRVDFQYPVKHYVDDYVPPRPLRGYREMDFVKEKLGVEVQFGKYAFMVYNVCAKMTIFKNLRHIDTGIEIVPMKEFAADMSSGVSYYEQFVWDLDQRGVSDIDIPVLILGVGV
ncbi:MAG: BglII/BstYI family type II restriction endonuclease [Gemmatimonadota bacterium]|nr:BglII/BstYI family type II restriction endonuclease [Gemmatimonadota bacterium]